LGDFLLRAPEPTDIDALYVYKNDTDVSLMLGGFSTGYSRRQIEEWLEYHRKREDEVLWAIADSKTDRCIGHVGLYKIDNRVGSAEFAILIGDKTKWDRGLGRACLEFALKYGFEELNLNRIELTVLATNMRAIGLYSSVGFREEGRLRQAQFKNGEYIDVIMMGLLRSEYVVPKRE
jgi:RimJ/RimL family protein N-acetyltransferase